MIKSLFKPYWWYIHLGKLKEPINEKQIIMQSLKQEIAFMPGSIFGAKDGYIRLSYGKVDIDQIEEGISRLREAILVCENNFK